MFAWVPRTCLQADLASVISRQMPIAESANSETLIDVPLVICYRQKAIFKFQSETRLTLSRGLGQSAQ